MVVDHLDELVLRLPYWKPFPFFEDVEIPLAEGAACVGQDKNSTLLWKQRSGSTSVSNTKQSVIDRIKCLIFRLQSHKHVEWRAARQRANQQGAAQYLDCGVFVSIFAYNQEYYEPVCLILFDTFR